MGKPHHAGWRSFVGTPLLSVVSFLLVTGCSTHPPVEANSKPGCFVGSDLVACIDGQNPRLVRIKTATQAFVTTYDVALRYVDIRTEFGGFVVAADGRIGLVSWSDASSEAKPLIVKFGGPATLTEVRIGRIIAWSNHDHLQVALDEHGKLLVTLPERLSARIAEIPDFPTSLGNVSIALLSDEEDVGTLVTVGGTVNGEPWMWKGRLP